MRHNNAGCKVRKSRYYHHPNSHSPCCRAYRGADFERRVTVTVSGARTHYSRPPFRNQPDLYQTPVLWPCPMPGSRLQTVDKSTVPELNDCVENINTFNANRKNCIKIARQVGSRSYKLDSTSREAARRRQMNFTLTFKMARNVLVTADRNPAENRLTKTPYSAYFKHAWIQMFK